MAKKPNGVLFGGDMFGGIEADPPKKVKPAPVEPTADDEEAGEEDVILQLLKTGPKHRDWLKGQFLDYEERIQALLRAGHVIKVYTLVGRDDWAYVLSENGRLYGVSGEAGRDPQTERKAVKGRVVPQS